METPGRKPKVAIFADHLSVAERQPAESYPGYFYLFFEFQNDRLKKMWEL